MKLQLTTSQKVLKRNIEEFQTYIREYQRVLYALNDICAKVYGHVIIPRNLNIEKELKTDKWASTGALCAICGQHFGWWCPKSPDHLCHYSKSEDDCDYCHMPMERK